MTKIVFNREMHRIELSGHAGSAEAGKDLVCAAESILTYTLLGAASEKEYHATAYVNPKEGKTCLQCYPTEEERDRCKETLRTIAVGFEFLAEQYPEFVRFEVI